jgi:hypothetical protein
VSQPKENNHSSEGVAATSLHEDQIDGGIFYRKAMDPAPDVATLMVRRRVGWRAAACTMHRCTKSGEVGPVTRIQTSFRVTESEKKIK